MTYSIILTETCAQVLRKIKNPVTRERIISAIDSLAEHPERGKPLKGSLSGYYSLRAASRKYRVIYRIDKKVILVLIVAIGQRKNKDHDDVYQVLQRYLRKSEKQ